MNNKNYDDWNTLKKKIHRLSRAKHPRVREIWWINIGLNIGSEIYGKGLKYLRPVLVLKVNDENFLGIPLSSKIRKSKQRFILKTNDTKLHSLVFNRIRIFDNRRLLSRKYIISKNKFRKIIRKFKNTITVNG
ncbi:type II toxin-antitoxin system PemK/MazF family toxin [Candidatus Parcubacteria bacterium]|nr:type II toxin-antitoxin system PemK/MazF family toxin [Candidatus Parcubacteria bacterium]